MYYFPDKKLKLKSQLNHLVDQYLSTALLFCKNKITIFSKLLKSNFSIN